MHTIHELQCELAARAQDSVREATLFKSEDLYALAFAATNDGIWERDFRTGEVHRSPRLLEILGFEPGELDPTTEAFEALIHPDDAERRRLAVRVHLETRAPYHQEYRIRRKSGDYIWVSAKSQAIWGPDGKPERIAGFIADISDRERADEALRKSEHRYRSLIENCGLGIHLTNLEGGRLFINTAFVRLLGYGSPEEIFDLPGFQLVTPQDRAKSIEYRNAVADGSNESLQYECDFIHKNGSIVPLHVIINKIVWDGEDAIQRIVIDLSERKQAERAKRASEDRLQAFIDHSPSRIFLKDTESRVLVANKA